VPEGPRWSLGEEIDWLQPTWVNRSTEVPPSLSGRKTAFLGSANAVSQLPYRTGGAPPQNARYDASMPALLLDIEVHPREESGISGKAKITFCTGSPFWAIR